MISALSMGTHFHTKWRFRGQESDSEALEADVDV